MLRPSRAMVATTAMAATAVDTVVMAVATTAMARGLLMPSLRPRPRLSPDTAITDMADMAVATTARGLLMLSLRLMLLLRLSPVTAVDTAATDTAAMVAMVATDMAVATT